MLLTRFGKVLQILGLDGRLKKTRSNLLPLQWAGEKPEAVSLQDGEAGLPEDTSREFWNTRVLRCCEQSRHLPVSFTELRADDVIKTPSGEFRVFVSSGYSPAAAMFHDESRGLLITLSR